MAKKNKYGNTKVIINDITFDSVKEAKRWGVLKLMERAGEISELQRQVRFPLKTEKSAHITTYIADFVYITKEGRRVVEDVKSPITRQNSVYLIKKKWLKADFGIEILET